VGESPVVEGFGLWSDVLLFAEGEVVLIAVRGQKPKVYRSARASERNAEETYCSCWVLWSDNIVRKLL
jgi:hypothetical protein